MFIHFAFGALGKQGKTEEQTGRIIELILQEKRLLVSKCKEFIPTYPKKGVKRIPPEMFKVTGDGEASATFYPQKDPEWLSKLPDDTTIHYLPMDVPMICFIETSFNKLKSSSHSAEYGKFGLVFADGFLKNKGIKPVFYYTESSLWNDELIRRWNSEQNRMSRKDKSDLEREILSYRKPATLFPSFKESVTIKLTRASEGTTLEYLSYDRYHDNYDFRKEKEYRIVPDEGIESLYFEESDIYMIITPDLEAKKAIETFLNQNWRETPRVEVYPT